MRTEELSLSGLKYFLDAVHYESLTRSAEINFVTRPAISLAIRRLEDWAGQTLLTHEKNVFQLTREGQEFYRKMSPVYNRLKSAVEGSELLGGPVRVGCSTSLVDHFLLPQLKGFKNLTGLRLATGRSGELLRQLDDGEIHLAIVISDRQAWPNSITLHQGEFILVSKSGELETKIVTTEPRAEVVELQKSLNKKRVAETAFLRVESWSVGVRVAAAVGAACLVPDYMKGSFKKVKGLSFQYPYQVCLIHRNLELLSENEAALVARFAATF